MTKHPFSEAGSFSLSPPVLPFIYFFTPDERRSAVMHDKKFNVRRRRGRWGRDDLGDGREVGGGMKVPEDRNDSI